MSTTLIVSLFIFCLASLALLAWFCNFLYTAGCKLEKHCNEVFSLFQKHAGYVNDDLDKHDLRLKILESKFK